MDGFLYWKRLEVRTEGVVQGLIGQRGGGEGGLDQGRQPGGLQLLEGMSPSLHLHSPRLCQEITSALICDMFQLPSEEWPPLSSFFTSEGLNLDLIKFLRKSKSLAEIIDTSSRMTKRKTWMGSRSILSDPRLVTVVEYVWPELTPYQQNVAGVTKHTRPTVSWTNCGNKNRNYITSLIMIQQAPCSIIPLIEKREKNTMSTNYKNYIYGWS